MQPWRLIRSGYLTGAENMALDEVLLDAVAKGDSAPVLRLYRWYPATVSLGYAQPLSKDIDLVACHKAGFDVVRRATGGRAVLHDKEMTYSVIAREEIDRFGKSVLSAYRTIAESLQMAVVQLGVPAELVPGKPRGGRSNSARAVCFSAPSQYELVVEGCKIAGSAQRRQGGAFLQHGSIPIEMNIETLANILPGSRDQLSLNTVGWLNRWADRELTVDELEEAFIATFRDHLEVELCNDEPCQEELSRVARLVVEKYGHEDWTSRC